MLDSHRRFGTAVEVPFQWELSSDVYCECSTPRNETVFSFIFAISFPSLRRVLTLYPSLSVPRNG